MSLLDQLLRYRSTNSTAHTHYQYWIHFFSPRKSDSPFAMSRQQFLERLGAGRDPARPVPIFAIGYGADADMGVLNEMAKLTGGRAVASNDPGDLASAMAKIFLAAHQQR